MVNCLFYAHKVVTIKPTICLTEWQYWKQFSLKYRLKTVNCISSDLTRHASNDDQDLTNLSEKNKYNKNIMPGNVVRGNQKLCKRNLYGCNQLWLTALEKGKQTGKCSYSRNIITRLQLDLGKSGNVVFNNFHFCTKEKMDMEIQAADF